MAINPFEPPRTRDLDAPPSAEGGRAVSAEAVQELVRSAPWVKGTVWTTLFSIVVGVLGAAVAVTLPRSVANPTTAIVAQLVGALFTFVFLALFVGYHRRVRRLAAGEGDALLEVIDSQRKVFKTMGMMILIAIPLSVAAGIVGVVLGVMARKGSP
jgi:hypothetical protein